MTLQSFFEKLRDKESLSIEESRKAFDIIFENSVPEADIANFLIVLGEKGETSDEMIGAVTSMRAKALTIEAPEDAIDIVGTGGDLHGTYNVSTAAALVTAACGVPVAKHGNRAATSRSGSSDVLVALGINMEPNFSVLEHCLAHANVCFMFAPRHHPAMRHVAIIRKKLGMRTIFNLLGPMTNPANVKKHLIGVYDKIWLEPMAETLQSLGSISAWLTHGRDKMDEITTTTVSDVVALAGDKITEFTTDPHKLGITRPALADLQGGDADQNAVAIHKLLAGAPGAYRDSVVLNSAAALVVSGKAKDIAAGMITARQAIDSGAAQATLDKVIEITNRVFV